MEDLSLSGLSLGLMIPTGSHCWLRPATWLANECRTMGGSAQEAAHGTCLRVYRRRELHRVCISPLLIRARYQTRGDSAPSEMSGGR